ncbi:MAG: amidinotransferase, partial [Actinomycetota bacterium]
MSDFGVTSMTAELRRVAVRPPSSRGDYAAAHWAQPVDLDLLAKQHAAFVELLRRLGCEVDVLNPVDDMPDGIFTYDPCFMVGSGFIELRGAKDARVAEPAVLAAELHERG